MLSKSDFLLDPEIVFLNHGSFGATPREVFENYQFWQQKLERQPVRFIVDELMEHLDETRQVLGNYLKTKAKNLVLVPNATFGVNIIARSLKLNVGDEILMTDHEYGACYNTWLLKSQHAGTKIVEAQIPLGSGEMLEALWKGITPNTRVIFVSHITSPSAQRFPVKEICARAKDADILTVIDGAHAPGQIPVDLNEIKADFYVGNCHKWMLSAKGAGFLYAAEEKQNLLEPLVVSWGWGENSPYTSGSEFIDQLEWWGTKDPAAYLSVKAAIEFLDKQDWGRVQADANKLLTKTLQKLGEITGIPSPYRSAADYAQMAIAPLPIKSNQTETLQKTLYEQYRIELPIIAWKEQAFARISVQAYNTEEELDTFVEAMRTILPAYRS